MKLTKNKYGNIKTVVDSIKFDSLKESNRYIELTLLQKAGEILDFQVKPKVVLQSGFKYDGKKIAPINFFPDFLYFDVKLGRWIYEDVKAIDKKTKKIIKTSAYTIKKKMLLRYMSITYPDDFFRFIET